MGWAGGSLIANAVWDAVKDVLPEDRKRDVAQKIIAALDEGDWDTHDEAPELMEAAGFYWCEGCLEKKWDGPPKAETPDGDALCSECAETT